MFETLVQRLALALACSLLAAGCASDTRSKEGLEWVVSQEAERQRLEAMGFPQYAGAQ